MHAYSERRNRLTSCCALTCNLRSCSAYISLHAHDTLRAALHTAIHTAVFAALYLHDIEIPKCALQQQHAAAHAQISCTALHRKESSSGQSMAAVRKGQRWSQSRISSYCTHVKTHTYIPSTQRHVNKLLVNTSKWKW